MHDILPTDKLASKTGGTITFTDLKTGEVLAEAAVPPGLHSARDYLEYAPEGCSINLEGVSPLRPPSRSYTQSFGPARCDSGANPEFTPTSAGQAEQQMRLMMRKLQSQSQRIDARFKAIQRLERQQVPKAPAEVEVLEDPAPKPKAKPKAKPEDEATASE